MTSQLDTRALERLASVFSPAMQTRVMQAGAKRMGAAAEEAVPPYAPVRTQKLSKFYTRSTVAGKQVTPFKSKFKTQGQAFKVLKLGEAGKIPYRRSGQLGRSIISKVVEVTTAYALVSIGTSLIGAQQVIGDDSQQSAYHAGNWWQLQKEMEKATPAVLEAGQQGIDDELATLLKGISK